MASLAEQPDLEKIKHPVKPMLWKIEGKGLKTPSYLFGTIHLSDSRVTSLHPLAEKAFQKSDRFYAEVDMSPANMVGMVKMLMRGDGRSLKDILGEDLYRRLEVEIKAISPLLDVKPFDAFKVWAVAVMLPQLGDQLKGGKALDVQLWERAKAKGKGCFALETPQQQIGGMDGLTVQEQKTILKVTIDEVAKARKENRRSYEELFNAYLVGDIEQLAAKLKEGMLMGDEIDDDLRARVNEAFLFKRNRGMAKVIAASLEKHPEKVQFFAAGSAHYLGEKNVRHYLKQAGYRIEPVQ